MEISVSGELLLEIQKLKVKTLALEKQHTNERTTRAQFPQNCLFNIPQTGHFRILGIDLKQSCNGGSCG